ncbi:hypothetical protein ACROYT_G030685 [Oculina patagonica]
MGDDVQLPPVCDTPVYIEHTSAPSPWPTGDERSCLVAPHGLDGQHHACNQLRGQFRGAVRRHPSRSCIKPNLKAAWCLYNRAVGTVVDIVYKDGCRPTDDPPPLPDVVFVRFSGYKGPPYIDEDPTLVPIVPIICSMDCACRCKRSQVPFRLSWGTTIHKCQGLTVGSGEAFRYVFIHPGKHDFEAKNPGALFEELSRAKSAGGEGVDPDFAFHGDVLLNDGRLKPVNTPTTRLDCMS